MNKTKYTLPLSLFFLFAGAQAREYGHLSMEYCQALAKGETTEWHDNDKLLPDPSRGLSEQEQVIADVTSGMEVCRQYVKRMGDLRESFSEVQDVSFGAVEEIQNESELIQGSVSQEEFNKLLNEQTEAFKLRYLEDQNAKNAVKQAEEKEVALKPKPKKTAPAIVGVYLGKMTKNGKTAYLIDVDGQRLRVHEGDMIQNQTFSREGDDLYIGETMLVR